MNKAIVLFAFAMIFAVAAAAQVDTAKMPTARPPASPATRSSMDCGSMVNDVRVELALFGSGTHLADVTNRVVQLLRSQPNDFIARSDTLHINDPMPGRNKSLLIRYRYQDQERLFMVTGQNRASYALLTDDDR